MDKDAAEPKAQLLADEQWAKKKKSFGQRFWTSWALFFGFIGVIYLGHWALFAVLVLVQVIMFNEIVSLSVVTAAEKNVPSMRFLNWLVD